MPSLTIIRELILSHKPTSREGYPEQVRQQVLAFTQQQLEKGENLERIASAIDLTRTTLARWMQQESHFRPVILTQAPLPVASTHTLLAPNGFRVEGLSLQEIASLLRQLT